MDCLKDSLVLETSHQQPESWFWSPGATRCCDLGDTQAPDSWPGTLRLRGGEDAPGGTLRARARETRGRRAGSLRPALACVPAAKPGLGDGCGLRRADIPLPRPTRLPAGRPDTSITRAKTLPRRPARPPQPRARAPAGSFPRPAPCGPRPPRPRHAPSGAQALTLTPAPVSEATPTSAHARPRVTPPPPAPCESLAGRCGDGAGSGPAAAAKGLAALGGGAGGRAGAGAARWDFLNVPLEAGRRSSRLGSQRGVGGRRGSRQRRALGRRLPPPASRPPARPPSASLPARARLPACGGHSFGYGLPGSQGPPGLPSVRTGPGPGPGGGWGEAGLPGPPLPHEVSARVAPAGVRGGGVRRGHRQPGLRGR